MSAFDRIYDLNIWGFGSGHGSLPSVTKTYSRYIEEFLAANDIESVVDYGCGDWQFSRFINWNGAHYVGVDVAANVVKSNNRRFASDQIAFRTIDPHTKDLPAADLLIVKDVLQHLSRQEIAAFLDNVLPCYRYALINNCAVPEREVNRDIRTGEFRPLDLRKPPFNISAEEVFSFSGPRTFSWRQFRFFPNWTKLVLLVRH